MKQLNVTRYLARQKLQAIVRRSDSIRAQISPMCRSNTGDKCTCVRTCTQIRGGRVSRREIWGSIGDSGSRWCNPVPILRLAPHFHAFSQIRSASTWRKGRAVAGCGIIRYIASRRKRLATSPIIPTTDGRAFLRERNARGKISRVRGRILCSAECCFKYFTQEFVV